MLVVSVKCSFGYLTLSFFVGWGGGHHSFLNKFRWYAIMFLHLIAADWRKFFTLCKASALQTCYNSQIHCEKNSFSDMLAILTVISTFVVNIQVLAALWFYFGRY